MKEELEKLIGEEKAKEFFNFTDNLNARTIPLDSIHPLAVCESKEMRT